MKNFQNNTAIVTGQPNKESSFNSLLNAKPANTFEKRAKKDAVMMAKLRNGN